MVEVESLRGQLHDAAEAKIDDDHKISDLNYRMQALQASWDEDKESADQHIKDIEANCDRRLEDAMKREEETAATKARLDAWANELEATNAKFEKREADRADRWKREDERRSRDLERENERAKRTLERETKSTRNELEKSLADLKRSQKSLEDRVKGLEKQRKSLTDTVNRQRAEVSENAAKKHAELAKTQVHRGAQKEAAEKLQYLHTL